MDDNSVTELKVDVGVLKSQVATLTSLCEKMDRVIEKIVDQQERYISQVYEDMEKRRQEKNDELREVNNRIDTVIDKVELTERRIMDEIRDLRTQLSKSSQKEEQAIEKLNQWKWTIAGGIIVISWLISHLDFDTISKLLQ
jgi:chromosome segregation ATPase